MHQLAFAVLATLAQSIASAPHGQPTLPSAQHQPTTSNSGGVAVFKADRVTDGVFELWATKLDGSAPWRVSGPLAPGATLSEYWLAPGGKHVAYTGEQVADGDHGLFVAPIDGSSYVRLTQPGENHQSTSQQQWSPDGQWIAFMSKVPGGQVELYSARPDGSQHTQLSNVSHVLGGIIKFQWAPDSSRIAYTGDMTINEQRELFTVTPDGLSNDRVHPPLSHPSMDVQTFFWSPDGSRIACYGDPSIQGFDELFTAQPDGGAFTNVTQGNSILGASVHQLQWTPDGSRLVFNSNAVSPNVVELFTVKIDGSAWTKLSGSLPFNGDVIEHKLAPDGSRVAYRADQTVADREELYTTNIDGTGNVAISGPFVAGGELPSFEMFAWSPDSQLIAYRADQEVHQRTEIFVAQPDGSGNIKVSGQLYPTSPTNMGPLSGTDRIWAPDSSRLLYSAISFGTHPISVKPDGTSPAELTGPLIPGGSAFVANWSLDGSRVVYRASQLTPGVTELFAADPDGADNQLLSGTMVNGGNVINVALD